MMRVASKRIAAGLLALALSAAPGDGRASDAAELDALAGELVDVSVMDQLTRQMGTTLRPSLRARFERAAEQSGRELDPERYAEFEAAYLEAMTDAVAAMRAPMVEAMRQRMSRKHIELLVETYRRPGVLEAQRARDAYVLGLMPMIALQVQQVVAEVAARHPPAGLFKPE